MKKRISLVLLSIFTCIPLLCASLVGCSAQDDRSSWRSGIFTTLSLSLESDGHVIKATVRNDFTLGLATIPVYVYLYSSDELTTVPQMEKIQEASSDDLDIFSSLSAEKKLSTEKRYYAAKLRYRNSDGAWEEICTEPKLFVGIE